MFDNPKKIYRPIHYYDEFYKLITKEMISEVEENRYWVSTRGNVYDSKKKRFVPIRYWGPYLYVDLHRSCGRNVSVLLHRLVAIAYIDGNRKLQVNHKDGIKENCFYENLEWVTPRENLLHATANGLNYRGEDKPNAILTNEQAEIICEALEKRCRIPDILKAAHLEDTEQNRGLITDIKRGKTFSFISKNHSIDSLALRDREFTNDIVIKICELFQQNPSISYPEVLNIIGLGDITGKERKSILNKIGSIKLRKAYTDISKYYNW